MFFQTGHGVLSTLWPMKDAGAAPPAAGGFAYLFPTAAGVPQSPGALGAVKRLAAQMADSASGRASPPLPFVSGLLGHLCQFADHDLRCPVIAASPETRDQIRQGMPLGRGAATTALRNQCSGRLDLSGLYGDGAPLSKIEEHLTLALRDPTAPAKWRLPRRENGRADVVRVRDLAGAALSQANLRNLTDPAHRAFFFGPEGQTDNALCLDRPILPDGRNGTSSELIQIHLAWARLHNAIVDSAPDAQAKAPVDDLFGWARDQTRLIYQWVMIFDVLARVCDRAALDHALTQRAPLYAAMSAARPSGTATPPLPLDSALGALPFYLALPPSRPDLDDRVTDNLVASYIFNLPTAQSCIARVEAKTGFVIPPLPEAGLLSGPTGPLIADTDLVSNTPLWFYIVKEAEVLAGGRHLGPLGSILLADTLVGVLVHDDGSVLNRTSRRGADWTPRDGVMPAGTPVMTYDDVLTAGGTGS
ncbi:hypothetical protein [Pseudooctadecabacter sp.]|uniref:hypothetical protein n=1 Tax=Pseudooctadecabacter sp. TaxID=1966338 RepID=UPI0025EDD481|nr:hypothetical protein [Pseudooctadecabacter sp.]